MDPLTLIPRGPHGGSLDVSSRLLTRGSDALQVLLVELFEAVPQNVELGAVEREGS